MWVHFRHFEKPSTGEYEQLNYSVGREKNVIHYFLCAFFFSLPLSTECRVMKGPKAQRGSAKSPGPIKRSKSPAESSEPDTMSPTL